jgi:hypothetical protein
MSLTFTKGLLKGAALAVAGAAALGAGSAKADFSCTVTLGTLGACTGGMVNGFTFSNISLTGIGGANGLLEFNTDVAAAPLSKVVVAFSRNSSNVGVVNGALTFNVQKPFLIGYEATSVTGGTGTFGFSGTNTPTVSGVSFGNEINGIINAPLASTGTYSLVWNKTGATNIFNATTTIVADVADVPVPLPVVGAGLAFGFTRRLRKRAKSVA